MTFPIPLQLEITFRSKKNRKPKIATYGKCYGVSISNGILYVKYGDKKFYDSFYFSDVSAFVFRHDSLTDSQTYKKRVIDLFTVDDHSLDELM